MSNTGTVQSWRMDVQVMSDYMSDCSINLYWLITVTVVTSCVGMKRERQRKISKQREIAKHRATVNIHIYRLYSSQYVFSLILLRNSDNLLELLCSIYVKIRLKLLVEKL